MSSYNVADHGGVGDGHTDDTRVIQEVLDRVRTEGGGGVVFPAGREFLTGPLRISSNTTMVVEPGATLRALPDWSPYTLPAFPGNPDEGTLWLHAEDADTIEITGGGTIDGNGPLFMGEELTTSFAFRHSDGPDRRPHLLTLVRCRNVRIHDISFRDSAYWCLHLAGCLDVEIRGVHINNNTKIRNGDGIDIDHSRNVHISGCTIVTGDDSICVKCRREYDGLGPSANITVSDCHLVSTSSAIKLGSENTESIRNVTVSNCTICDSNRGIAIQNRDEGAVENIIFANLVIETRLFGDEWWGRGEPIYVTAVERSPDERHRFPRSGERPPVGIVRDVLFSHILCRSENGVYVSGSRSSRPSHLVFDSVGVEVQRKTGYEGGSYDRRPTSDLPMERCGTSGIYLRNTDDVSIRWCEVQWEGRRPDYYGPVLRARDVRVLEIRGLRGSAAHPERGEAVVLEDCTEVLGPQ